MLKDPSFIRQDMFQRDSQGNLIKNSVGHPVLNRIWKDWFTEVVASQIMTEDLESLAAFDSVVPRNEENIPIVDRSGLSDVNSRLESLQAQILNIKPSQDAPEAIIFNRSMQSAGQDLPLSSLLLSHGDLTYLRDLIEENRVLLSLLSEKLPDASKIQRGAVNWVDQTFAGRKYFQNAGVYADQWVDTLGSALGLRDTGANVPILTQYGATAIWMPKFALNDKAVFIHQLPHGLRQNANVSLHPHVHWVGSTTDAANVVRWELTYQWLNPHGGVIAAGSTVITVDDLATAATLRIKDFADITQAGMIISSLFMGTLRRITNGATDYAGDVFLAYFDLHCVIDSFGSDLHGSKTWPAP